MKYCIEWDYKDNTMMWKIQIEDHEDSELKDFIMYWMPWLIEDLFIRFWKNLKEEAKAKNISYDKIIGVISLMSIVCLNTLSDKLTSSLNEFLADDPTATSDEDSKEANWNNRDLLLWNK